MINGIQINTYHVPVLLNEAIGLLAVKKGQRYADATAGGGGHTRGILQLGGKVIAIDQDKNAIEHLQHKFWADIKKGNLLVKKGNFVDLDKLVGSGDLSGIIFDLGVANQQLKGEKRGFSFQIDEKLDMRMNQDQEISAFEVVNKFSQKELAEIFRKLGEERLADEIALSIVRTRTRAPIATTGQLAQIVDEVYKRQRQATRKNAATQTFQALRIYVNNELEALKQAIPKALQLLGKEGRLVVISYHSLEDRIVKQIFNKAQKTGSFKILTKKPVTASIREVKQKPSSRSAKLRAILKI